MKLKRKNAECHVWYQTKENETTGNNPVVRLHDEHDYIVKKASDGVRYMLVPLHPHEHCLCETHAHKVLTSQDLVDLMLFPK